MRVLAILLLLMSSALAQVGPPQPSPLDQALSEKLTAEISANIQLRMQLITAQAKIKELEDAKQQPSASKTDGNGRERPE